MACRCRFSFTQDAHFCILVTVVDLLLMQLQISLLISMLELDRLQFAYAAVAVFGCGYGSTPSWAPEHSAHWIT